MLRRPWLLLVAGVLTLAVRADEPAEPGVVFQGPPDVELLRAAEIPTDGPGLLAYLRKRVASDGDEERLRALVRRLGDESYAVRERASRELVAAGSLARAVLRQALEDPDREISWRAERCLAQIEKGSEPEILAAALRVLAALKPQGAAEVILGLLPIVEDPGVLQEAGEALAVVAVRQGKPEPVLVQALTDRRPAVRAVAAETLCRAGPAQVRPAVRKLLHDADAPVRCRVAVALVEAREKEAIPTLIGLLADAPPRESARAEEALNILAGDSAPVGFGRGEPRARRAAWEAWWAQHRSGLDLAQLDRPLRPLGFTLVAQIGQHGQGEVLELDAAGRVRWLIGGLRHPIDVQVLAHDRILVCEYAARVVSERNLKGEVLWEKAVPGILLAARRLPGGRTFIVTKERLLEVDASGKEVWSLDRPHDVAAACRLRNGQVVLVTNGGRCLRLDADGKQLHSFPTGVVLSIGTQIECLPGGHILIPMYSRNQVVEYDAAGRVVWSAMVARPNSVQRLPNGHTLISSRLGTLVLELDRNGDEVWRYRASGRPMRALRR
jgi:hypothetical protein